MSRVSRIAEKASERRAPEMLLLSRREVEDGGHVLSAVLIPPFIFTGWKWEELGRERERGRKWFRMDGWGTRLDRVSKSDLVSDCYIVSADCASLPARPTATDAAGKSLEEGGIILFILLPSSIFLSLSLSTRLSSFRSPHSSSFSSSSPSSSSPPPWQQLAFMPSGKRATQNIHPLSQSVSCLERNKVEVAAGEDISPGI